MGRGFSSCARSPSTRPLGPAAIAGRWKFFGLAASSKDDDPLTIERLQRAYRAGGLKGYWSTQLEFAVPRYEAAIAAARTRSPQRYVSSIPLAELYARAGDNERALALLQDSYRNRDENLRWLKAESLLPNSPWETVRRDPRFADMLRGMGLDGPAPAPVAAR